MKVVDYGARVTVTCLDQRVMGMMAARTYPHVSVDRWGNLAEVALGTGVCWYKTFNMEDQVMIRARVKTGLHDRMLRGPYLRKILESYKRKNGLREEIAFSTDNDDVSQA